MRQLEKAARPEILTQNAAIWTQALLDAIASDDTPTQAQKNRYNHPQIKAALKAETLEKCAYCESRITHIDHGDIEHIVPKSKVPALAFDWDNLTLACRICNQNKGDFLSGGNDHSTLIDTYHDNPSDHFLFYRELVLPRPDSARALLTDSEIGLSRSALREQRRIRFEFIDGLLRGYCDADPAIRPILRANILRLCCSDDSEYAALARQYVQDVLHKLGL